MRNVQRIAAAVLFAIAIARVSAAQSARPAQSPAPTPVLVELFTSEGCSSCPPADALLAQLDGSVAPSGQQIIALSEHVTYWNRLGWTDPFSLEFFTDRQNAYAQNARQDEVYTPQIVVNGDRGVLGSDRSAVLQAIRTEGLPLPLTLQVLSYRPNGVSLSVMFTATGKLPANGADLYALLVDDADTTSVPRGENAGRTLKHVAVARAVGRGMVLRAGEQTLVSIPLTTALRAPLPSGRRLVLVAQLHGQGRVLGLASEPIPASQTAPSLTPASIPASKPQPQHSTLVAR